VSMTLRGRTARTRSRESHAALREYRKRARNCGSISGMMSIFDPVAGPQRVVEGDEVESFLRDKIGIEAMVLGKALLGGAAEAAMVTPHSGAAASGWRMYDGVVKALRDELVPEGWRVFRPGGLETVVRNDNHCQITAALGNEHTGLRPPSNPSCEHERGAATLEAVDANQRSLAGLAPLDPALRPIQTWWLLYHFVERDGDRLVRAELSLPVRAERRLIVDWACRVLLGEFGSATTRSNIPEPAPEPFIPKPRRRVSN